MMQHRRAAEWESERRRGPVNKSLSWETRTMPLLSQRSIETLLDLVEVKLSCLEVYDREDAREKTYLETSRRELMSMIQSKRSAAARPTERIAL
jgi:hypothetical protein